jgi:uncharacterized protein (DUF952 family)
VLTASFIKTRTVTALHDHPIDKKDGYDHPSTAGRVRTAEQHDPEGDVVVPALSDVSTNMTT